MLMNSMTLVYFIFIFYLHSSSYCGLMASTNIKPGDWEGRMKKTEVNRKRFESHKLKMNLLAQMAGLSETNFTMPDRTHSEKGPKYLGRKLLGWVYDDDPVVKSTTVFPWNEKDIDLHLTMVIAQRCLGRRKNELCSQERSLDGKYNYHQWLFGTPKCDVLTVTIHGFTSSDLDEINQPLLEYNFKKYHISCLLKVDWSYAAAFNFPHGYHQAAANVITVGRILAAFIYESYEEKFDLKNIHLIGHSLGAQVAHQAAVWLRNLTTSTSLVFGLRVGRITGLDPAAPLFERFEGAYLKAFDADFVDIIHTSHNWYSNLPPEATVMFGGYGMYEATGTIDFYPNAGSRQPGCGRKGWLNTCHHSKALWYFRESLLTNKPNERTRDANEMVFPSYPCSREDFILWQDGMPNLNGSTLPPDWCSSMGMQADKFFGFGVHCLITRYDWRRSLLRRACADGKGLSFDF